ncbi:MAG TPA: sigma-70 family RNA polymerase sigma factor [Solirubrobacteraceae bacterium]|nr:sigma-70 family RNA polymerase sigma factor [Solirubrobacteraceae bacterium]
MAESTAGPVTQLLVRCRDGDRAALDELLPLVYGELRRIAQSHLRRERAGHTLQSTALVHEAYLRLIGATRPGWQDRAHFFGIAANAMRQILVDHARARAAAKRGSGAERLELTESMSAGGEPEVDVLALDEALGRLAALDRVQARIVELRFFAGLTIDECAEALAISPATVKRDWTSARAWLHRELSQRRG